MFEHDRNYPTAITPDGAAEPEHAQRAAISWIAEQQKVVGGQILLLVPSKGNLSSMNNLISRFAKAPGVVVDTIRGGVSPWPGGPVLAAWPTREALAEIADDPRTRALCVIPWNQSATRAWEQAAAPERLLGAWSAPANPALDPVVAVGLMHLSRMVNHANNLAGALDHRDAIAVLRALRAGGYALPADEVYGWALAHGWPSGGAERLRGIAQKIDAGRSMQIKGGSPLRPDALERWRAEASRQTH